MAYNFSNLLKPSQVTPVIASAPVLGSVYSVGQKVGDYFYSQGRDAGQLIGSTKVSVAPARQIQMSSLKIDNGKTTIYASESPRTLYVNSIPVVEIPTNKKQLNYIADERYNFIEKHVLPYQPFSSGKAFHDFLSGLFPRRNKTTAVKYVPLVVARPIPPLPPAVTPKAVYVSPTQNTTAGKTAVAMSKVPGLSSLYRSGGTVTQSILQRTKKQNYNKKSRNKKQKKRKRGR